MLLWADGWAEVWADGWAEGEGKGQVQGLSSCAEEEGVRKGGVWVQLSLEAKTKNKKQKKFASSFTAPEFFFKFLCYEVFAKQKKKKCAAIQQWDCHMLVLRTEETLLDELNSYASVIDLQGAQTLPKLSQNPA